MGAQPHYRFRVRAQGVEIRHSAYLSLLRKVRSMSQGGMLLE